jgi:hypothetical protein
MSATWRSTGRRSGPSWLPLLRRLSAVDPGWCVWKNADQAVAGIGDVDSAAPRSAWPALRDDFRAWAVAARATPAIVCTHAPGLLVLVARTPDDAHRLLQVDVYARVARTVDAAELAPVIELDARGFRRLRRGAEDLFALLAETRRPARPPGELEQIRSLLASDPRGVEDAAALLGAARKPALAGARAVVNGGWNYAAMAALEPVYLAGAVRRPQERLRWLRFRLRDRKRCAVLAALDNDRSIPDQADSWLAAVASNHAVYER